MVKQPQIDPPWSENNIYLDPRHAVFFVVELFRLLFNGVLAVFLSVLWGFRGLFLGKFNMAQK